MSADRTQPGEESFEAAVGHVFGNPALAELALSHPSYAHELDGSRGNERLEFLGDAVLDLAVGELLFHAHPDWSEGDLTRSRAALVNQRSLADCARGIGLDRFVKLGRTEQRTAGEQKNSVLANCLEAVAGAIYLDAGPEAVLDWVRQVFGDAVAGGGEPERRDAKTMFQEWGHARFRRTPSYRTVRDSGTDNAEERFSVEVLIGDEVWGTGVGRSKRIAEGRAAAAALERGETLDGGEESDD
jgi:ribonuclease-3